MIVYIALISTLFRKKNLDYVKPNGEVCKINKDGIDNCSFLKNVEGQAIVLIKLNLLRIPRIALQAKPIINSCDDHVSQSLHTS